MIASHILDMDTCILEVLEWRMNGPAPQEFVYLLLGLMNYDDYCCDLDALRALLDFCTFQCELASADYDLSICKPSVAALASIINGLDGISEELLSDKEKCLFLKRVGGMMPRAEASQVRYALAQLRKRFCHNSEDNLPKQEPQEMTSSSSYQK